MAKRSDRNKALASQQADLWEHACLLFHNFEWQDAADTFNHLRQTTSDPDSQAFCSLNAGLILARLGDLANAHQAFDNALRLDRHEPITHFLLGLIEAEFGNAVTAQARFEMCLDKLGGGDLDYRDRRLEFTLTLNTVRRNAAAMWAQVQAQHGTGGVTSMMTALERLPAELLFEAPPRALAGRSTTSSVYSRSSRNLVGSWGHVRRHSGSHISDAVNSRPTQSLFGSTSLRRNTTRSLKSLILRTTAPAPFTRPSPEALPPDPEPFDINKTPTRHFTARDARVPSESTRELASFIRHAGPATTGKKVVTIDREYMLRLLENDVGTNATEDIDRELARDGIDSVLDFYANYSGRLSGNVPVSVDDGDEEPMPSFPRAGREAGSGSYGLFPPLRRQLPPTQLPARTDSIARKPIPSRVAAIPRSIPIPAYNSETSRAPQTHVSRRPHPGALYPSIITSTASPDPHPGTPYHPTCAQQTRPGLSTAERWLRKEVRPPWAKRKVSTASEGGSEGLETLPSTVSSMEIFGLGNRARKRG